jgi:multiple sugar transport system substrate-binding protein
MRNNVRIWLIFITIAVITAFTAKFVISSFTSNPATTGKPLDTQTQNQPQPKKTIVFSFGGNDPGGSMKATIEAFEKSNPGIGVKIQQLPNSTDYQRDFYKRALYSGDSSIDVFFSDIIWTAELASSNWVLPLDGYFNVSELDEFLGNALEGCKYNGRLYAIPARTDIPLLFYRSDIIQSPPKTYKEMMELSKKYREANGIKFGYVFQGQAYEGLVCTALEFIWNNGGNVMQDGHVVINSPEAIEGLQSLVDIVDSGVATSDVFNFQEEDARIAFQDGNALFMRNWPYAYNQLASANSKVKGKFNIAPLPLGPKGKVSKGTLGGWNYMVNRNTKNLNEALEFVKCMSSYEIEVLDCYTGGNLPTRKAAYDDPRVQKANPWIKGFISTFENADLRPASPSYSAISKSMQANFSNAIQGKISASAAIENIEKSLIEMSSASQD